MLSNWNALLSNIMAAEDDVVDSWEDADTEVCLGESQINVALI